MGPGDNVDSASDDRTVNNTMRHSYRVLNDEEKALMAGIKDAGEAMLNLCNKVSMHHNADAGREVALARTKIEEAVMWAVKGLTK